MIWFDLTDNARRLSHRVRDGMPHFISRLIPELAAIDSDNVGFCVFDPFQNKYRTILLEDLLPNNRPHLSSEQKLKSFLKYSPKEYLPPRAYRALHHFVFSLSKRRWLARRKFATILPTDTLVFLESGIVPGSQKHVEFLKKQGVKTLGFLVDALQLKCPYYYSEFDSKLYARATLEMLKLSDKVICASGSTARDLQEIWKMPSQNSIEVVPLAHEYPGIAKSMICPPGIPKDIGKFVLYVSSFAPRKNQLILYQIWHRVLARGNVSLPKIVFAGQLGYGGDAIKRMIEFNPLLKGKAFVLSDLSDNEIAWLYTNCEFSIYPSLYEGWGLPVGESLFFGKLCLSSNTSSLPEVGGDFVEYFDPFDVEGLEKLVLKYSEKPSLLKQKESTIRQHFRPRIWRDTATELLDTIKRAG